MPSRNSVNKPKDNILRRKKAGSLGQKRASIRAKGHTKATLHIQASPASLAHTLYNNKTKVTTPVTTQTLSAKRLLKIERNKKYADARNKNIKKGSSDAVMEIDENDNKKVNKVTLVRNALWSIVEHQAKSDAVFGVLPSGNGTTLGEATF